MSTLPTPLQHAPARAAPVPDWPTTVRLDDKWTITERIDGTRAVIRIEPADTAKPDKPAAHRVSDRDGRFVTVRAASRTRWLVPEPEARATGTGRDNFGFAAWVAEHAAELAALGPGTHRGVWYGSGIGHGYGLAERRLALLDTARWHTAELPVALPDGVALVPVLDQCIGRELNEAIAACLDDLGEHGSKLIPGAVAAGVHASSTTDARFITQAQIAGA